MHMYVHTQTYYFICMYVCSKVIEEQLATLNDNTISSNLQKYVNTNKDLFCLHTQAASQHTMRNDTCMHTHKRQSHTQNRQPHHHISKEIYYSIDRQVYTCKSSVIKGLTTLRFWSSLHQKVSIKV